MIRHPQIILFALLGSLLGGLGLYISRPQPRYGWRSLDSWVMDFRLMEGPGHEKAKDAVRQMGTNALPKLIEMLHSKDPVWKVKIQEWIPKYRFQPASVKHWRATTALEALGPAIIPSLLEGPDISVVQDAIIRIGEKGILPLETALTNVNPAVRTKAASALGWLGTDGEPGIPALIKALEDPDKEVRRAVTNALLEIDMEAAETAGVTGFPKISR